MLSPQPNISMSKDSLYSYVHFIHPQQALYMEQWEDCPIPYNDINTSRLFEAAASIFPHFMLEDEEEDSIPMNSSIFGAKVYKNQSLLKKNVWSDLNVDPLRSNSTIKKLPDATILKSLHMAPQRENNASLDDFLSNGYNTEVSFNADTLLGNKSHDEIWLNTTSEFLANHTFANVKLRSNSGSHANVYHLVLGQLQTPRIGRTRQPSQEKFQTPITRIR